MDDILMNWEDAGQVSPPGDPTTDEAAAYMEHGWELGAPTSSRGDARSGLGGGGDLCHP